MTIKKPISPLALAACSTVLAAALAAPAMAYDSPVDESGFYVGLSGRLDQIAWNQVAFTQKIWKTTLGVPTLTTTTGSSLSFPQSLMGAGLTAGYRFSRYLALEAGLSLSSDEAREIDTASNRFRYRLTLREAQADAYAYLPLGSTGWFKPFLSLGMAYTQADARVLTQVDGSDADNEKIVTETYSSFLKKGELNWRVGTGIEIRFSESTFGRVFARYQPYSFDSTMDGGATLGFALTTRLF